MSPTPLHAFCILPPFWQTHWYTLPHELLLFNQNQSFNSIYYSISIQTQIFLVRNILKCVCICLKKKIYQKSYTLVLEMNSFQQTRCTGNSWCKCEADSIRSAEGVQKYLPVLCSPTLHKTHADGAHPGELVNRLEALVNWLSKEGCKLLVVENL